MQVVQTLEGPQENVMALYTKIAKDARHTACATLSEVTLKARIYAQCGSRERTVPLPPPWTVHRPACADSVHRAPLTPWCTAGGAGGACSRAI